MKNKKIFLSFGFASILAAAIPLSTIVSCSSQNNASVSEQAFNTKVSLSTKYKSGQVLNEVNIYDAKYNDNAQNIIKKIESDLTVENLQFDFNTILTNFYEAYEQDSNNYEIEIEKINVISKNNDGTFNLEVQYSMETNLLSNKDNNEQILKKEIKWKPNVVLIDKNEINKIKEFMNKTTSVDQGFDLSELKEIFFGEKDADEDDDKGIFDKIAQINKNFDNLAYLVGYEITIDDIFKHLQPNRKINSSITTTTPFKIPSLYLNAQNQSIVVVPDKKPAFLIDTKTNLTLNELDQIILNSQNGIISDQALIMSTLNTILLNKIDNKVVSTIKELQVNKDEINKKFEITIIYTDPKTVADRIIINLASLNNNQQNKTPQQPNQQQNNQNNNK